MGCEIRHTFYIQGIIPCGYRGIKLSGRGWHWMASIWRTHPHIWLHHCGGVWTCSTNQKQFSDYLQLPSLHLVQATVEAETIVKILCDGRGDDHVYQAWRIGSKCRCASIFHLPRRARHQIHRNKVEADSPFHYWQFALYNVFVDNIVDELGDQFIVLKPTFTAQLLIPTNLHKMTAVDQLII